MKAYASSTLSAVNGALSKVVYNIQATREQRCQGELHTQRTSRGAYIYSEDQYHEKTLERMSMKRAYLQHIQSRDCFLFLPQTGRKQSAEWEAGGGHPLA